MRLRERERGNVRKGHVRVCSSLFLPLLIAEKTSWFLNVWFWFCADSAYMCACVRERETHTQREDTNRKEKE